MKILHSESAKIYDKIAQTSIFLVLLEFVYTQPKNLHARRYQRLRQISGMGFCKIDYPLYIVQHKVQAK